jgi:phosphoglycolate phosphatase-like HAD superfamily hydrolase
VRVALERLGIERAWMIGDTPDDIRAAAAAGVMPIGIIAPGADLEANSASLLSAGAVTILENVASVTELLPPAG